MRSIKDSCYILYLFQWKKKSVETFRYSRLKFKEKDFPLAS